MSSGRCRTGERGQERPCLRLASSQGVGAERLETTPAGYRVVVKPGELDMHRFEAALDDGRFADALALWRGEPLADFRYAPFAQAEARRLEGRWKEAVAALSTHASPRERHRLPSSRRSSSRNVSGSVRAAS